MRHFLSEACIHRAVLVQLQQPNINLRVVTRQQYSVRDSKYVMRGCINPWCCVWRPSSHICVRNPCRGKSLRMTLSWPWKIFTASWKQMPAAASTLENHKAVSCPSLWHQTCSHVKQGQKKTVLTEIYSVYRSDMLKRQYPSLAQGLWWTVSLFY